MARKARTPGSSLFVPSTAPNVVSISSGSEGGASDSVVGGDVSVAVVAGTPVVSGTVGGGVVGAGVVAVVGSAAAEVPAATVVPGASVSTALGELSSSSELHAATAARITTTAAKRFTITSLPLDRRRRSSLPTIRRR